MNVYYVWSYGRTLLGEFDVKKEELEAYLKDTNKMIQIKNVVEVKSFFVPTPNGLAEIIHTSSIIPFRKELMDLYIKIDLYRPIEDTEELFKLYTNFRAELTGIIVEPNLNQVKLRAIK